MRQENNISLNKEYLKKVAMYQSLCISWTLFLRLSKVFLGVGLIHRSRQCWSSYQEWKSRREVLARAWLYPEKAGGDADQRPSLSRRRLVRSMALWHCTWCQRSGEKEIRGKKAWKTHRWRPSPTQPLNGRNPTSPTLALPTAALPALLVQACKVTPRKYSRAQWWWEVNLRKEMTEGEISPEILQQQAQNLTVHRCCQGSLTF